jgi:MerR family Zn(II)-responsive transcriptional regulator of zntA
MLRIGEVAARSGMSIDTIRFYEKKGLLDPAQIQRTENGYRAYSAAVVERLALIKHAQAAGFTLTEIGELFELWDRDQLDNHQIIRRLEEKQRQITQKIAELEAIRGYIDAKLSRYQRGCSEG